MRKYLTSLLILLMTNVNADACSYFRPSPKEAYEYLSILFDGDVWAVYIDDKQIPLSILDEYQMDYTRSHEIKIKIKPTKFYQGPKSKFVTLINKVSFETSCTNEVYIPTQLKNSTWGGVMGKDGRYHTGTYARINANIAVDMIKRTNEYADILMDLSRSSSSIISDIVDLEVLAIDSVLKAETNIIEKNFNRRQIDLEMLPINILEVRQNLMNALNLPNEALKTQTAMTSKDTPTDHRIRRSPR
ncbi:hypothetical protein [Kordiimonas sp. SCSIO 12610]|uniref:hypothetical protein n=1 Tax=Kordiimonas sp. SCSIO 12610 TaxID=2829597 RepID=UPI00210E2CC8|nr:hypothetical protein [Kordiimonas sp. SCSIO 12610]UTW56240.1 hypothetical protein KFF44_04895 [Kordiimonas sp. SCSIO 12610]